MRQLLNYINGELTPAASGATLSQALEALTGDAGFSPDELDKARRLLWPIKKKYGNISKREKKGILSLYTYKFS